jgi:hypothetical protein
MVVMLFGVACHGESTQATMTVEIIEFDCADCPDLFERYAHLRSSLANSEFGFSRVDLKKEAELLDEIERVARKVTLLNHSQRFLIGDGMDQVTRLQNSEFRLKALTKDSNDGFLRADLDFSLTIGDDKTKAIYTEVVVQRGQALLMGGAIATNTQGKMGVEEVSKTISLVRFRID